MNKKGFSHRGDLCRQILLGFGISLLILGVTILGINYYFTNTNLEQQFESQGQSITRGLELAAEGLLEVDRRDLLQQVARNYATLPAVTEIAIVSPDGMTLADNFGELPRKPLFYPQLRPELIGLIEQATSTGIEIGEPIVLDGKPVLVQILPFRNSSFQRVNGLGLAIAILDLTQMQQGFWITFFTSTLSLLLGSLASVTSIGFLINKNRRQPLQGLYRAIDLSLANKDFQLPPSLPTNEISAIGHIFSQKIQEFEDINRQLNLEISDRLHAEKIVEQQIIAMEATIDGIAILNAETYFYLNQAHADIFGYENPQELLGKTWRELYHPEEIIRFEKEIFPILKQQKSWRGEAIAKRRDGTTFAQEVSLSFSGDRTIVCVCRDISDRKQAERQIRQKLEKEQELSQLKLRLISCSAHDFRNLLTGIYTSVGILKSFAPKLSEKDKEKHLQKIENYAEHLARLSEDILLLERADYGQISFNPEPLDLLSFCRSLVEDMQGIASDNKLIFSDRSATALAQTCMDPKLLLQILTNLLSNAVKYSSKGGEVNFDLTLNEENAIFQVKDYGIGIPPEDREHIFESFHRATNVGKIFGTGLGLSIVKTCVDLHQGEISFTSEVGEGTTFSVKLPRNSPRSN